MTSVTSQTPLLTTSSFEGMTYGKAKKEMMNTLNSFEDRFTHLNFATDVSIKETLEKAQKLVADKNTSELTKIFKDVYPNFSTVLEEFEIAKAALSKLDEAIKYCTPANVSLRPEQVKHMIKQGYDMSRYATKELALADSSTSLEEEFTKLDALIKKTQNFVQNYPIALNGAARFLRQTTRSKTWGDVLPETCVGTSAYFMKGFDQFQKPTNPEKQIPTESQKNLNLEIPACQEESEPSASDVLAALQEIVETGKNAQTQTISHQKTLEEKK